MAYGLKCYNADSSVQLDTTDIIIRLIYVKNIVEDETSTTYISTEFTSSNTKILLLDISNNKDNYYKFYDFDPRALPEVNMDASGNLVVSSVGSDGTKPIEVLVFAYV